MTQHEVDALGTPVSLGFPGPRRVLAHPEQREPLAREKRGGGLGFANPRCWKAGVVLAQTVPAGRGRGVNKGAPAAPNVKPHPRTGSWETEPLEERDRQPGRFPFLQFMVLPGGGAGRAAPPPHRMSGSPFTPWCAGEHRVHVTPFSSTKKVFFFLLVLKENKHVKRSQCLVAPALCLPGLMESETLAPGFRGDRAAPPWPLVTTGRPGACSRESEVALHLDKRLPAVRVGRAAFAGPTARLITFSSFWLRLRPAQGAGGCPEGVCVCVFLSTELPRTPGVEPGDGEKEAGAEGLQAAPPGPQDPCCWGWGARVGGLSWGRAS